MRFKLFASLVMVSTLLITGCGNKNAELQSESAGTEVAAENLGTKDDVTENLNAEEVATENLNAEDGDKEINAAEPGIYQALYSEEMEGEEIQSFHYITIDEDNTGLMIVQDEINISVTADSIKDEGGTEYKYTYNSEDKTITLDNGEIYSYIYGGNAKEFAENHDDAEYMYGLESWIAPSDFVEEAAGKTRFESYEELISYLEPGQGYAYIKLFGCDKELLLVTDMPYDYGDGKMVSTVANVHGFRHGRVEYWTVEQSLGTSYPLAVADGILYVGGPHSINGDVAVPDGDAIMLKFTASEESDKYEGFIRETNSFDDSISTDVTTKEQYDELYDQFLAAEPIEFTIVE